jgi:transcriptional antiterminator NusG
MDLFVLQCLSGKEDLVRKKLRLALDPPPPAIHIPRRVMNLRRSGEHHRQEYLLFPGYLFIEAPSIGEEIIASVRKIPEALKFLPGNHKITPLNRIEKELMSRLLFQGEVIGDSAVRFDENNRISVVRGPLKGLEGNIVKVNRRKGRAKVSLDLYDRTFEVDFSFFDLQKTETADN